MLIAGTLSTREGAIEGDKDDGVAIVVEDKVRDGVQKSDTDAVKAAVEEDVCIEMEAVGEADWIRVQSSSSKACENEMVSWGVESSRRSRHGHIGAGKRDSVAGFPFKI